MSEKRTASKIERTVGIFLLLIILFIAVGIYVKGQHYDPNIFAPDISKYREDNASSGLIDTNLSPNWKPMSKVEFYNADNLYEKINGKAEQYHDYDVGGLETATFISKDEKQFVDIYIYDMGEPLNAFGIFSAIRYPDEPAIDLGQGGYKSDGYFFWKGKYYNQIILSDRNEEIEKFALKLAQDIESKQKRMPVNIWGLGKFPEKDLIQNSIEYLKKNALNLSFLNDVYVATYDKNGREVTAFLTKRKDKSEADKVFEEYRNYLSNYGSIVDTIETEYGSIVVGDVMGYFDAIFQKDNIIGGTNAVDNRQNAQEISKKLLSSLSNQ